MKFVVTGGRGFIGSHFVELALKEGHEVVDYDCMTYCSNEYLPFDKNLNYKHINQNICEIKHLPSCDIIFNFAAETHVDNSINDTAPFLQSNIFGVYNLLEILRGKPTHERPLFFHISTDEVYGDKQEGSFTELDKLTPSNPYSASKAAAEMLVLAYHRTYGIDYIITRSSNNYGPRQYSEKLIPKCLECINKNKKIPLHGDGSYVRDWIYVEDNVSAIYKLGCSDIKNEIFNIGVKNYLTNLEVATTLLKAFDKTSDDIIFVENRWGQDVRYSIDNSKVKKYVNWNPKYLQGIFKWWS